MRLKVQTPYMAVSQAGPVRAALVDGSVGAKIMEPKILTSRILRIGYTRTLRYIILIQLRLRRRRLLLLLIELTLACVRFELF